MIQKSNTLTNLHPFWRWFARVPARLGVLRLELNRVCVSYINKKLLNASGGGGNGLLASHIEAVKEGEEEPVSSGPSSLLVDYGSGWKLQTVIESHGDKGGCFQLRKCNAQYKPDHEWVQCTNAESGGC